VEGCIRIWIRIIKGKAGSGSASKRKLCPDLHQSEKQDPDLLESEKVEGHFGALEGPNLEKREWQDPDHIER
jgi:hypothetical protein